MFFIRFLTKGKLILLVIRTGTEDSLVISRVTPLEKELIRTGSDLGYDIVQFYTANLMGSLGIKGYVTSVYPSDNYNDQAYLFSGTQLPLNHKVSCEIKEVALTIQRFYSNDNSSNSFCS